MNINLNNSKISSAKTKSIQSKKLKEHNESIKNSADK